MDLRRSRWILGVVLANLALVGTPAGADEPNRPTAMSRAAPRYIRSLQDSRHLKLQGAVLRGGCPL